ncbi:hypothetical protein [Spiroplasma endosymbiont of Dioctria linearis]|uniref:hypothetical protein n=1 Tax=Spiroplasma endosymbiont of Dioctria linearis TaxID=3066290 RepID=UPI00313D707F
MNKLLTILSSISLSIETIPFLRWNRVQFYYKNNDSIVSYLVYLKLIGNKLNFQVVKIIMYYIWNKLQNKNQSIIEKTIKVSSLTSVNIDSIKNNFLNNDNKVTFLNYINKKYYYMINKDTNFCDWRNYKKKIKKLSEMSFKGIKLN